MEVYFLLFVALGLPLIAVIGNAITRWFAALPQSAPADFVLAVVIFDAVVAAQSEDFKPHIQNTIVSAHLVAIYIGLILVGMFLWGISVWFVERRIVDYYDWSGRKFINFPFFAFFLSLLIPVMAFFVSVAPLTYKG